MEKTDVLSFSSNTKHYDELYRLAAMLENMGYVTLIPIDAYGLLSDARIYNEKLAARNNNSLDDMRKRRIDLSDDLIVYLDGDDALLIHENTGKDILHAIDKNKEIWIAFDNIYPVDIKKHLEIGLGVYGIKGIDLNTNKLINLNGGYSIHLIRLNINK